ncbi:ATP-dependent Clp protease adapter ClpS [Hydrogenovibrio sp. 3SP14C1]|uniref:ATP-dependent Clp protease adapter protein ClpS n=1 Tax=Hydrogenovibrio crunogenus TaxID=39765 RepID=A0A4P7P050_9GAMM|nr:MULTISPECIES: ATP-dependent Clp protease adapter ClpS [Hydrogenovibrio]MDG4813410.1 ATP-dependent Clp protease adapter ClpS [Hydrogenovibrio sp. 3SP14C1]QBZ83135.1 ATP-dependent Clp protease adapter protein ClpS [Hydrogenovibrio crunogenus]RUM91955.1 MAG: ATP-dependent Clp protease adapter ClpS [Thiomicrospira sp.]
MPSQPFQDDGVVLETARPKVKPPKRYQVVLLNDDFTPMDFVVDVLTRFFGMDEAKANTVMLAVHTKGKGTCGVYSREVAEMKVMQVNQYAREHQHPLQCEMEVV